MAGRGVLNEGNGIKENCKTWAMGIEELLPKSYRGANQFLA